MKKYLIRPLISVLVLVLLSTGLAGAKESKEWQSLFDGNGLSGWVQRGGEAKYHVEDGVIVGTTVPKTRNSFLCTKKNYGNFILELEFKVDPGLNSGVQIRSNSIESYRNGVVHGYQVEIDPSDRAWSAGIYDESRRGWLNDLRDNEPACKAFKQNEWNHLRIAAVDDSIKTWLNGVAAADLKDSMTATGFIGLQVHASNSDKPLQIRWRNIRIQDLDRKVVAAKIVDDQVVVSVDDEVFTCYKFASSLKKPYFWPVNGPLSGKTVTVESTEPYPHHNSLFFGCDRVNDGNYWQDTNQQGQIISQVPKITVASGESAVFTDECLWKQPDKEPVIRDRRVVTVTAPSDTLRFIDFEITLEPLVDIRIGKTNHSLFSARVMPELSVEAGGTLVNAQGDKAEKGTFGINSPWCDYFGKRGEIVEGIAILQHPANRWYPSKWFTRDYGFFSPTPMYWPENDSHIDLAKGEAVTLQYRVVVHGEDAKAAGIAELFQQYYRKGMKISDEQLDELCAGIKVYTFGQSRKCLTAISKMVTDTYDRPELREKIADKLAQILEMEVSFAGKQFACQQLSLIGTAKHVPVLAGLLGDEQTSGIACYGLERISGPEANEVLLAALAKTSGRAKIGIIHSLGERGDNTSVEALSKLVYDSDESVSAAAMGSLGKIANVEAVQTLKEAKDKLQGKQRLVALDAYLNCAVDSRRDQAISICREIFDSQDTPPFIRAAGLRRLLELADKEASELIKEGLASEHEEIQGVAIEFACKSPDPDIVKTAAAKFENFSTGGQVQFLSILSQRDYPNVSKLVIGLTKSMNTEVRIAAIKALGRIGDESLVMLLAELAADTKRATNEAARESLASLKNADSAIVKALDGADVKVKCELIKSIAQREIYSATQTLLKYAGPAETEIRRESVKALGAVGDESILGELAELLVNAKNNRECAEVERTILAVLRRASKMGEAITLLLGKYESAVKPSIRCSLLRVLSETRDSTILPVLQKAMKDSDLEIRKAAIKSLSRWPNTEPIEDLLWAVQNDMNNANRILALDGYITMAAMPSSRSAQETVGMLSKALSLAQQPREKKMVLAVLPRFPCQQAIELAETCLQDTELKTEADIAIEKIKANQGKE